MSGRQGVGSGEDFEKEVLGLLRSIHCGLVVAVAGIALIFGYVIGVLIAGMIL